MTTFTKQIHIQASKAEVWDVVSNLGDIYKYNPNVHKSYYTSVVKEGKGATRICELYPNGKVSETAVEWEKEKGFLLLIEPIEGAPPVKDFSAKILLEALEPNKTRVKFTLTYKMKLGLIGELLNKIIIQSKLEEAIRQLARGLKLHMEQGVEVENVETLKLQLAVA